MGTVTSEPDAPASKQAREANKCKSQASMGFRLVGLKVYRPSTKSFESFDRHFGRALTDETVSNALKQFFIDGQGNIHAGLVTQVLIELEKIQEFHSRHTEYSFFASSLLVYFDGTALTCDLPPNQTGVGVRMIDFAHTRDDVHPSRVDYLHGVTQLQKILSSFIAQPSPME
eukprot:c14577_g1_i1.p1 GENE.c14577_g1_i1~~c14577_g1_i1.p1  ORF type:complete len:172 (+),score=30.31 c14577_g1_i1:547-1062(+)